MEKLGSKLLVTERLELRPQRIEEQKRLWEILMMPEVNKYYLDVPKKFIDKLYDWNIQKNYYEKLMEHSLDIGVFKWSVFLKNTNTCIGYVISQDGLAGNPSIRGVGWYFDPTYWGKGYASESAKIMIDYLFKEVKIDKIISGAAIVNPGSWKIMEKLGFKRLKETEMIQYTFLDEKIEDYKYEITREDYLKVK